MRIALIAALGQNQVIGAAGGLPWRLPDDLRFFKRLTLGKPLLLGRKTYESIGRPLPRRLNIVLTRDLAYRAPGCVVVHSVAAALQAAGEAGELMVGGGAALYARFLPLASVLYLTEVQAAPAGDTFFPAFDRGVWQELSRERHPADARHAHAFAWVTLTRRRGREQKSGPG